MAGERGDIFEVEGARRDGPLWRWDLVDEATLNIHLRIDGHHILHWADGGATELENLVSLCRPHHRAVHEQGWRIHIADGSAVVEPPP